MPFAAKRGRENCYDTAAVIKWMIDREKLRMAKTQVADGEINIDQERARKERALADRYEMENEFKRGTLVEADAIQRLWGTHIETAKKRLLPLGKSLSHLVVALTNAGEAQRMIDQEIRDALEELSGSREVPEDG